MNPHQFVVLILLIPLPLFFSSHIFGVGGLTGWVSVGIAWTFLSAISVVLYPLYESRQALGQIATGIYKVCHKFHARVILGTINSLIRIFSQKEAVSSWRTPHKPRRHKRRKNEFIFSLAMSSVDLPSFPPSLMPDDLLMSVTTI